ncbi:MAG: hypothetical protein C0412_00070 [Flavobacterium sp.]|nr:hypothetical protein [Flavobacterium sp.]
MWAEAMQYSSSSGAQGICPTGWHIPTYGELGSLRTYVSNDGNALKALGQGSGDGAGTNTSGFSALLAGRYTADGGYFWELGQIAFFWGSTPDGSGNASLMDVGWNNSDYIEVLSGAYTLLATSVRCIYDSPIPLPVELESFEVFDNENFVNLNWRTATEINNYGFEIQRKSEISDWQRIGFVQGHGNSNSTKKYYFIDDNILSGTIKYRLKQIDFDGKYEYSKEVDIQVEPPNKLTINYNYPNPFNPSTRISYSIPTNGLITLKIFDVLGNEVTTLVNEDKSAGKHEISFNGKFLSSGTYICKLRFGNSEVSKKLLLLK